MMTTDMAKPDTITITRAQYDEMNGRLFTVDIAKPQIAFIAHALAEYDEATQADLGGISGILSLINGQLKGQVTREDYVTKLEG